MKKRNLLIACISSLLISLDPLSAQQKYLKKEDIQVTIYFARHGKTILNTMDRVQGWVDSPLTSAGVEVAEDLGRGLSDTVFVSIYTSDSGRARETADLIMKFNKHTEEISREEMKSLREWNFGSFEAGYNKDMFDAIAKATGIESKKEISLLPIPEIANTIAKSDASHEAENWDKIQARIKSAIDKIVDQSVKKGGGNVLVVAHGLAISSVVQLFDSKQAKNGLKNASITKVIYKNGKYEVVSFNDMQYVERGKQFRTKNS